MKVPSVCAVMLTANRVDMALGAIDAFKLQTYPNARLAVVDSGYLCPVHQLIRTTATIGTFPAMDKAGCTIGELRNLIPEAMRHNSEPPDIFMHWDDDDLSHPNRIAEQVQLLQASGADCVGYREVLFWRDLQEHDWETGGETLKPGEAWLYSNPDPRYCIGASLMYHRRVWEKHPFPALPTGPESSSEDNEWLKGVKSVGVSGLITGVLPAEAGPTIGEYMPAPFNAGPRLLCRIHGQNTMNYSRVLREGPSWKRVPAWDRYCRERFA